MISNEQSPAETVEQADAIEGGRRITDLPRASSEEQAIGSDAASLIADELKLHQERPGILTMTAVVRGYDVDVRNVVAGGVLANNDVALSRGFTRAIVAGHDASLEKGGSGVVLAGENVTIRQGGAQAILAAGTVQMEQAGSGLAIARRIRVGRGGVTVFAIAGSVDVAEGGKVVVGRRMSTAILAALAAGIGLMVATLIGRRRTRKTA